MITPQTLVLTIFLTVAWGAYFFAAVRDYRVRSVAKDRRRGEAVRALRRVVVSFCLLMLPLSVAFRSTLVLAGFGNDVAGGVVFFSLAGTNVVGSLFCLFSLRYD